MAQQEEKSTFLAPGKNCWRTEKADKVSFLIDADAYFRSFREAVKLARETIFICGWDIDSRLALLREDPDDGYPVNLRDFLNDVASRKDGPSIYILIWDFAMFIGMDREWFPIFRFDWKTHHRIHLEMDDQHPIGASQHQKLVIIDDYLVFTGGLDLTLNRWDTPAHKPGDKRRRDGNGELYRPHHDVQMMVSGKIGADLGEFFRERWLQVSGHQITAPQDVKKRVIWPGSVKPDIEGCHVGIARTRARFENLSEIREVEQLYLDSIYRARDYIYIENQYLTSPGITKALAASLQQEKGPEIIIVLPLSTDGWLSQHTMDLLRQRAVYELQQADGYNRLGVFYTHQEDLSAADSIKIHSKLMIADDVFVRIGSANLNNRSMGLDTEFDLAVEAGEDRKQRRAVADLCSSLLAEHLGVSADKFGEILVSTGSRLQTIRRLQGNKRTLRKLEAELDETVEFVASEQNLLDPEEPIESEILLEKWLPLEKLEAEGFFRKGFIILLIFSLGMAAAWRFTPLYEMTSREQLLSLVDFLKTSEFALLYVAAAYVLGSVIVLPITVLITLTVLIYGSVKGIFLALLGAEVSGAITYWLGRIMGRKTVRKLAGGKINPISKRLGKRGIFSTFIIRLMPIAPYSIVNIVAGATHIRFRDFMIGTFFGMLPGTLAIAGLIDRGAAFLTNPSPLTVLSLLGVFGVVAAGYLYIQKKLQKKK